jgi:AcrR family transcriptional regulator
MQAERTTLEPRRKRGGRPPATLAGDVDRRILVAATGLFLRLGFDATSCDQVVALAGAGKASLYARYANKEALFVAVVHDAFARMAVPLLDESVDLPLHARLRAVGESILRQALQPDMVALLRVILSIAHRMPDLAQFADRIGREQAVQRVAVVIAGKADLGATDRALPVAAKFIDLVFVPYQMRALMGDEPEALMASASRGIDDAVDLLAKAGWLEGWE